MRKGSRVWGVGYSGKMARYKSRRVGIEYVTQFYIKNHPRGRKRDSQLGLIEYNGIMLSFGKVLSDKMYNGDKM
jgi:hypothetical protein